MWRSSCSFAGFCSSKAERRGSSQYQCHSAWSGSLHPAPVLWHTGTSASAGGHAGFSSWKMSWQVCTAAEKQVDKMTARQTPSFTGRAERVWSTVKQFTLIQDLALLSLYMQLPPRYTHRKYINKYSTLQPFFCKQGHSSCQSDLFVLNLIDKSCDPVNIQ